MATGVLIVGVGKGTKSLQSFLGCTKSYEATILFGAATDSYDTLGKTLSKAPFDHVTREEVEKALPGFRGKIMQRPPLYSALHVQGKRLYEYAREGKEVPVEIEERPVEVKELEIVEWLPGGTHDYRWPAEEVEKEDKVVAEKVLHLGQVPGSEMAASRAETSPERSIGKRKRSVDDVADSLPESSPAAKRQETGDQMLMSGALQSPDDREPGSADPQGVNKQDSETSPDNEVVGGKAPPAVKLRMTVTSGFYVRSLAHDLGKAVGSLGCMSELVRTRQEQFDLGRNVLEMGTIDKGEEVWAPKLEAMLEEWERREEHPNRTSSHAD